MIDVDLQDIVFRQACLDLEREQRLVQFAGKRFLAGQEKVPCDLHRDGGSSLTPAAGGQIGISRPDDAEIVHTGVLVEAFIFGGEDGLFHDLGDIADGDDGAALLPEFADQDAFYAVYAQRYLRPVIGKRLKGGQIGISEQDHQSKQRACDDRQPGKEHHREGNQA